MFDVSTELKKFYEDYVKIDKDTDDKLCDYRDKNKDRLETGLTKLGHSLPNRSPNQGSYAMRTMVKCPNNEYDIDVAVIFDKDSLPDDPTEARVHVRDAVLEAGGNFSKGPEARTNAVTVWYQDGYHVDLAIYRMYFDAVTGEEIIEHAGKNWTPRDPMDITNWFKETVKNLSPVDADVDDNQMRRIVKLLKMFVRAYASETFPLPGGLLISVLVSECYVPHEERDDVALYNTLAGICDRLSRDQEICNPVDSSQSLTDAEKYQVQVSNFHEKLQDVSEELASLNNFDCTNKDAFEAWNKVFNHDFWQKHIQGLELEEMQKKGQLGLTSKGFLPTRDNPQVAIKSPEHRFFGDVNEKKNRNT